MIEFDYREYCRGILFASARSWAQSFKRHDFREMDDKLFLRFRSQSHLSQEYREAFEEAWCEEWDRRTLLRAALPGPISCRGLLRACGAVETTP